MLLESWDTKDNLFYCSLFTVVVSDQSAGRWGGLAFPSEADVQRVAAQAIHLFDSNPCAAGAQHVQSQRFLSKTWGGLRGDKLGDPPLRGLMESLALGDIRLVDIVDVAEPPAMSLLKWVSAFRHAPESLSYFFVVFIFVSLFAFSSLELQVLIISS